MWTSSPNIVDLALNRAFFLRPRVDGGEKLRTNAICFLLLTNTFGRGRLGPGNCGASAPEEGVGR